jgi:serine/threonine protein kinase
MTTIPDFTQYGYQVVKELGHNSEGGRFTYLAQRLVDQRQVVVKQFQFAKGSGWDGFGAIEKEIKSLQGLSHRGIPKYLDKLETSDSFCIITEYFAADTLAVARSFTPDEIKQIAVQILEILVYLQERMPPVIHRDIKPENILVDDDLNVYLIDFGFARVGGGSVAMSSAAAGTFGFMAPEQIRNLKLSNASDLYGLGLTMICLIGAIRSIDIGNYIDFSNQLDRSKVDPKLKGCSLTFVKWLDQMVAPDPSKRFADAKTALEALKPLYVVRVPEVKFFKDGKEFDPSKTVLEFKATKLGEKLTQTITLVNSIPETFLEGHWEVAPHPNDPAHSPDDHVWISFGRKEFKGNRIDCKIGIDTSKLTAQGKGRRSINLYLNTADSKYDFMITIQTASLPIQSRKAPVLFVFQMALAVFCGGIIGTYALLLMSSNIGFPQQMFRSLRFTATIVLISFSIALIISSLGYFLINGLSISKTSLRFKLVLLFSVGFTFLILAISSLAPPVAYDPKDSFYFNILWQCRVSICLILCLVNSINASWRNQIILLMTTIIGCLAGVTVFLCTSMNLNINLYINSLIQSERQIMIASLELIIKTIIAYSVYLYLGIITGAIYLSYLLFHTFTDRQRKIADYRRKEEHLINL